MQKKQPARQRLREREREKDGNGNINYSYLMSKCLKNQDLSGYLNIPDNVKSLTPNSWNMKNSFLAKFFSKLEH